MKITLGIEMLAIVSLLTVALTPVAAKTKQLSDAEMENLVRRCYQYVAMFNVNNKFALDIESPMNSGGYNRMIANTELANHEFRSIARPNNDTLYASAQVDVTAEPMVMKIPAFDSVFVSLMVTAYDHYVNIPMSKANGDFDKPSAILFYSERTQDYDGKPVKGIDKVYELSGDFASAVIRVMPHANEPERLATIQSGMEAIELVPLSEFLGAPDTDVDFLPWDSPPVVQRNLTFKEDLARFPEFGSDFEIFEDRLLEVMQFVVNHTTFDPDNEMDVALLAALKPLGVVPGKEYDPETVADLDGAALRSIAEKLHAQVFADINDPKFMESIGPKIFQPKGKISLDTQVFQSIIGPIGQPRSEAAYTMIITEDGKPMNAMHDYEIVMGPDEIPPVIGFWSVTLYDSANGFFLPNDRFKYSVGENAGYKLDKDGGIRIVIAAEKPEGVPEENWLPVNRGDYDLDMVMRLYYPDVGRFGKWMQPVARKLN